MRRRKIGPKRRGKIALVAMIVLLVIVVLMAWVGNTGHVVKQKMEVQNAADATAFAGSLWMARGMNGITSCNHLIGEGTAIGAIHDAIGGPELRLGVTANTRENRQLDDLIRRVARLAPAGTLPNAYIQKPITDIDKAIIDALVRKTSPRSNPEMSGFATLYDARMTLQRDLVIWLTVKSAANVVLMVPPWLGGVLTAPPAILAHIGATARILLIFKEWLFLDVLQAYAKPAGAIQEAVFADQLVPTLAEFSAAIAGLDLAVQDAAPEQGFAVKRLFDTMDASAQTHDAAMQVVPGNENLRMPVEFEPKPNGRGREGGWPAGWGDDRVINPPNVMETLFDAITGMSDAGDDVDDGIANRQRAIDDLAGIRDDIREKLDQGDFADDVGDEYRAELEVIDTKLQGLEDELDELQQRRAEMDEQSEIIQSVVAAIGAGESENLSLDHFPSTMDPRQEQQTQWLRATVPNLDAMRAPLLGLMESQLKISKAAEHFEKWTNRYAMIQAWKFRSGMRLQKSGNASLRWADDADPLSLVVLRDSFRAETSVKGDEPWTRSDADGKRQAERYFTLLVAAHREYDSLFATDVLKAGQSDGLVGFSQSILYNANDQLAGSGTASEQAIVGWDTLNWNHAGSTISQWGSEATQTATKWPWELFDGLDNAPEIKLNWQAKLVPVTSGRLTLAADEMDDPVSNAMELAAEHHELVSH